MTDFIKQLKEQINIADVVGEYVRLKKAGSNHMGLCPFHAERSPSFSVSEKKGIYHCFGCQRGGDAISFIQEIQGVSFHEAVRTLAGKFNIKLPPEFVSRAPHSSAGAVSTEDKLEVYYKLNRFVAQFYHEKLLSAQGQAARDYLRQRGITDATIKSAYLGYAPAEWSELYDFLAAKKAPLDKAEELGLIRRKSNSAADASGRQHYDLFRDRVIFPVLDLKARVIAFGGRALGEADGPKYLNSSESPIYKKGAHLFGLFTAQKDIRAEDACILVEGFMDCLTLQQGGVSHTVATLGTALTARQIGVLKRFTRNILVLFDGDSAGQEAQSRAMEAFLDEDVVVRGVTLPDGNDPDEFLKEFGAEELKKLLRNAPYLLDQRILDLAGQAGGHAEARSRAVDLILPWIAKISSDTARLVRLQELSPLFGVDFDILDRRLNELRSKNSSTRLNSQNQTKSVAASVARPRVMAQNQRPAFNMKSALDALDARLIECFVEYPEFFQGISDLTAILNGMETEVARNLALKLFAAVKAGPLAGEILEFTDLPALKSVLTRALARAEQDLVKTKTSEEKDELIREVADLEKKLTRRGLERRKENLRATLLKAGGSGQSEEFLKLMSEYNELVKRLDETKGGQVNI